MLTCRASRTVAALALAMLALATGGRADRHAGAGGPPTLSPGSGGWKATLGFGEAPTRIQLKQLKAAQRYEVRVSYPADIMARVSVSVDAGELRHRRRGRRLLDLEKAVFLAPAASAEAAISASHTGRTAPGVPRPTHLPVVVTLEACPLGVPLFAWRAAPVFVCLVLLGYFGAARAAALRVFCP